MLRPPAGQQSGKPARHLVPRSHFKSASWCGPHVVRLPLNDEWDRACRRRPGEVLGARVTLLITSLGDVRSRWRFLDC